MSFAVRTAFPDELDRLAAAVVDAQLDPQRRCGYLGDDAASIAADLSTIDGTDDWSVATHVALDDERNVLGWIAAETDASMGRVWWWGPILVDREETWSDLVLDALFTAGTQRVEGFDEHELAIDPRSTLLARFAERHGFVAEEGSVALRAEALTVRSAHLDAGIEIADVVAGQHVQVAALHDLIFPGTHTSGAALLAVGDEPKDRLAATLDGTVVGYVATEIQIDGSLYIDYLGVAESVRGTGVGRALIGEAMRRRASQATYAHLTVRESLRAARALYASLGFVEERVLVPYRRGFSLA